MSAHAVHLPVFRNEHLSVSRLKRYEQCPLAFYYQYVSKPEGPRPERGEPAEFGTVLHAALEATYLWIVQEEYEGAFPESQLLERFRLAWSDSGLGGLGLYQEGRTILRQYAASAGPVDHMRHLAVEREFNLLLGPGTCRLVHAGEKARWAEEPGHFVVNGFIDRVDRVDAETVEVVDYKSNRMLFSREELADDLQVSVYAMAVREIYPWVRDVRLTFHMLRHDLRQRTSRTPEELDAAREYVLSLGARTERGPYEARLNPFCGTCDHRSRCDAYESAVSSKLETVAVSASDLESLARERERVARIAKAAYARKEQLDGILKARIEQAGGDEGLELAGVVYRLAQYSDTEYPARQVAELLRECGIDAERVIRIDNKALDALLDEVEGDESLPRTVRDFLRVRVAAKAVKIPQRPRIDARQRKKA